MAQPLMNITMNDGSRKFGELPQSVTWYELRQHIGKLDGASVTEFITDDVTEAWIDFSFRGYQFAVNNQFGAYWFFASDPQVADEILGKILSHCGSLLDDEEETLHIDGAT